MGRQPTPPRPWSDSRHLFPDLHPYTVPSTGLLSSVPLALLPYAELARIDKPGFALLWLVHIFGILHAGILLQTSLSEVLYMITFFFPACKVLMCVNFAWNDTCDVEFDGKVARTRHRPLVRKALSLPAALVFDCGLAIALAMFLLPLPRTCSIYAIPMALGCLIYPLSKRWTNFPQLILGLVAASGVFMGAAAVGAIPLPFPSDLRTLLDSQTWVFPQRAHAFAILHSYFADVVWIVLCETIYSFQDVQWDQSAGIGTITQLLKGRRTAKAFLCILATTQVALHAHTGYLSEAKSVFWPISVAMTIATLIVQIFSVRLEQETSCMFWFAAGNIMTGLAMLIGYAGEYYNRNSR